jgi:hypothetical protein
MNPESIILTGDVFGQLTCVEPVEQRSQNGCVRWLCDCDCGGYIIAAADMLRVGHVRSCGCGKKRKEVISSGQRYGRLIVIEKMMHSDSHGGLRWLCECDCGNLTVVRGGNLRSGNTTRCGVKCGLGRMK